MNGEHEVRLERIERSLRGLHEKVDGMIETGAVSEAVGGATVMTSV